MFYFQLFLVMEQINHRTRGASISFQDQIDNLTEQIDQLAGTADNVSSLYLKAMVFVVNMFMFLNSSLTGCKCFLYSITFMFNCLKM